MKTHVKDQVKKSLAEIIQAYLGVDVCNTSRKREIVDARMIYFKLLRDSNYSFASIGQSLNKDHATVVHACKKIKDLIETDKAFRDDYETIRDVFFQFKGTNPTRFLTRSELLNHALHLEKQIKELNLYIDTLNNRLTFYQRYEDIVKMIDDRNFDIYSLNDVQRKITHLLNGIQRK